MYQFDSFKLWLRANKYRYKNDKGGIAYLRASLKAGQTAMDIGAHKAGYLYYMPKKVGKKGRVFAFEPQNILYNYLKTIKKQQSWQNVSIEHLALSDVAKETTLYIPKNKGNRPTSPGATIVEAKGQGNFNTTETLPTATLDTYCKKQEIKPDFLKIDAEGNELQILKGGIDTLKANKPKILVEIEVRHVGMQKALETFKVLEKLGYTGYFIKGLKRMPLEKFSFNKHQNTNNMKRYYNNFVFE